MQLLQYSTSRLIFYEGFAGYTAYGPSKYAVRGLAENLRNEVRPEMSADYVQALLAHLFALDLLELKTVHHASMHLSLYSIIHEAVRQT